MCALGVKCAIVCFRRILLQTTVPVTAVDAVMTLPVSTDDGRTLSVLAVVMVGVTVQPTQPATVINKNGHRI